MKIELSQAQTEIQISLSLSEAFDLYSAMAICKIAGSGEDLLNQLRIILVDKING